jgi:hypothetical protein
MLVAAAWMTGVLLAAPPRVHDPWGTAAVWSGPYGLTHHPRWQ